MQKSIKQVAISLAAGTAFALVSGSPTHEAAPAPRIAGFAETSQSPNVKSLASAVIALCKVDKVGGVTLVGDGLQCTVPIAGGGAYSLEVSSVADSGNGYPDVAFVDNVSIVEANQPNPETANLAATFFSPSNAGIWQTVESAQGYRVADEITGQETEWELDTQTGKLSSPDKTPGMAEAGWVNAYDDALANLTGAKRALGAAAAGVAVPVINLPAPCTDSNPCN